MQRTRKTRSSSFALQDSSIFKVEFLNAVSSSLLGSSSIFGRNLLDSVRKNIGISAANFNFPGSFNILTNPLTYPEHHENKIWLYSLAQKGFVNPIPINEHNQNRFSISIISGLLNQNKLGSSNITAEKVGGSDVSLSQYDSINDLKDRYIFDEGVTSFLLKKTFFVTFLNEAYTEMIVRFPSSKFVVELKMDPEISEWTNLFLNIEASVEDLCKFEQNFQDFLLSWMFKQSREVKSLITIVDKPS